MMMLVRLAAATALFAGGACAALVSLAKADDAPVLTKSHETEMLKDGAPFEVECERGSYLSGFEGQAGDWIDYLRLVCARWNAVRGRLEAPVVLEESKIGQSEEKKPAPRAVCPTGLAVGDRHDDVYAHVEETAWVLHSIEFHCVNAVDGMRPKWRKFGSSSPTNRDTPWLEQMHKTNCPHGYLATGVHGRAAKYIHALGFVCRPRPTVSPVAEAKPPLGAVSRVPKRASTRIGNDIVGGGVDIVAGGDAPLPPPAQKTATAKRDVNIHEKANGASRVLGIMREDKTFPVVASDPEGDWYLLQFDGTGGVPDGQGWVTQTWLTISP